MPKVKAYTPSYLATGPGSALFAAAQDVGPTYVTKKKSNRKPQSGPRRTIARRGTELFVAVGREIRWGDMAYMKDMHETQDFQRARSRRSCSVKIEESEDVFPRSNGPEFTGKGYRTIKAPVIDNIRQLILSPNGKYLAVVTTHTCHIMVIPDSSHLTSEDTSPIKPKIWTLGPTTHVTSKTAIASVLWHPLGVDGGCVVTVTEDAIVRVWELSLSDRWSFDQPTLDIDLKKLADGITLDQNFSSSNATNTGFSPDSIEMEVASACFASRASGGWSPFTLWVSMREGDVYALCPLLPSKWSAPPSLIPSLSVAVVDRLASVEADEEASEHERLLAKQQMAWMASIDSQEPSILEGAPGEPPIEVFARPAKPGACPRLQGPFEIIADLEDEDEMDSTYTDILVIGPRIESEDLMFGEEVDLLPEGSEYEGLSTSIICLLSTGGQVKVCLDIEGVEAQWLPPKSKSRIGHLVSDLPQPELLLYQAMDSMGTADSSPESWPMFSTDVMSKYSFYVTHNVGITSFSLANWVFMMESELQGTTLNGSEFRIGQLVNKSAERDRLYVSTEWQGGGQMPACVAINDADIGYGIISMSCFKPVVLLFDLPEEEFADIRQESPEVEDSIVASSPRPLFSYEPRPAYAPSIAFGQPSMLPVFLERLKGSQQRVSIFNEIQLSPLTLHVLTDVHKVLSDETHQLGLAASELFLKCDRMHAEMRDQLAKAAEIKARIDKIVGGDEGSDKVRIEARVTQASSRQKRLAERLDALRRDAASVSRRELSNKERAFVEEVSALDVRIMGPEAEKTRSAVIPMTASMPRKTPTRVSEPWQRFDTVINLAKELKTEAQSLIVEAESRDARAVASVTGNAHLGINGSAGSVRGLSPGVSSLGSSVVDVSRSGTPELRIPSELRKTRLQQVKTMLGRETALIEAVTGRLERLQVEFKD